MELNTVCVAARRAIDSLALGLKVCVQVPSTGGPSLEPTQLIKESFYNRWGNKMGWDSVSQNATAFVSRVFGK